MNIETAVIFLIVIVSWFFLYLTQHVEPPEPVYDPLVRQPKDRAGEIIILILAAVWIDANFGTIGIVTAVLVILGIAFAHRIIRRRNNSR